MRSTRSREESQSDAMGRTTGRQARRRGAERNASHSLELGPEELAVREGSERELRRGAQDLRNSVKIHFHGVVSFLSLDAACDDSRLPAEGERLGRSTLTRIEAAVRVDLSIT